MAAEDLKERRRSIPFEELQQLTRVEDIPMPGSLVVRDDHRHILNLPIFFVGPYAERLLSEVQRQTSGGRRAVSLAAPGLPTWDFLPVRLGEVRGWIPILYLYAVPDAERLIPVLENHGKHVLGFVVAGEPESYALEAVSRCLPPAVPFVVFGSAALADRFAALTGSQPALGIEPNMEHAMQVLKAITRPVVQRLLLEV